jgi:hypothetical protein
MSVSGFKDEVADIVETEPEETVESVSKDQMGNVYGIKRGSSRMGSVVNGQGGAARRPRDCASRLKSRGLRKKRGL